MQNAKVMFNKRASKRQQEEVQTESEGEDEFNSDYEFPPPSIGQGRGEAAIYERNNTRE